MKNFPRNAAVTAGAGILFALSFGGLARAITDTVFHYSTPQTGYYSISPMALVPNSGSTGYSTTEQSIFTSPTGTYGCFVTGVNLPDRARIAELRTWAATDTDLGIQAILFRVQLSDGTSDALVNMISHNTSSTRFAMAAAVAADKAVVVNQRYNYAVEICLAGANTVLYSGRLTYTYTNAGD